MLEVLKTRRSVRRYEDRAIEPEVVERLKESVLRAPTSRNRKATRFTFVTDGALLERLAHAKAQFGEFLAGAALGVVVGADESVSDVWVEDCSIAAIVLQLAAADAGLGSCWIQIRERTHEDGRPAEAHVREILGLPGSTRIETIISIGYPAESKPQVPAEDLAWDHIETR